MVLNEFKIVNLSNNKGLKFAFATATADRITIGNVTFSIAGQESTGNYGANWGGFKRYVTINFKLTNDGTDKSTDSTSKITLRQQWDYLMGANGIIQGNSSSQSAVRWRLTIYRDGTTDTITGLIEDIDIQWNGQEANQMSGTLTLFEANST